ncbi:MAG: RNA methyltransferase [Patescibacteria group bacterium]|jgi:TrmH family RNA methyltransferase
MIKNLEQKYNWVEINSLSNNKLKLISKLLKDGGQRQKEGLIIVDGKREIEEAIKANWKIKEFFYCADFSDKKEKDDFLLKNIFKKSEINYKLSKKAFEKISYKKTPDGYLAILSAKINKLENFEKKKNSLILVLEAVEKPGNLGGIIRTAYASGVDLIILNDQKTDLYSPNVIRSSTGFIFSMPIVLSSVEDTVEYLTKNNIEIFLTATKNSKNYFDFDFSKGGAIVFGTEAFGLSKKWLGHDFKKIKIPMIAGVDSLNVSVSVGIIIYEAVRQKNI